MKFALVNEVRGSVPNATYCWVYLATFRLPSVENKNSEVLQDLLLENTYKDSHMMPEREPEISGEPVHGPYKLKSLSFEHFSPSSADEVRETAETFPGNALLVKLAGRTLYSILEETLSTADAIFRLSPTRPDLHEIGWILQDFHEFVIISRIDGVLFNLLMGAD